MRQVHPPGSLPIHAKLVVVMASRNVFVAAREHVRIDPDGRSGTVATGLHVPLRLAQ